MGSLKSASGEPRAPAATGELRGAAKRLALLLAAAMFVLVVDTSLMNVSIAYVVRDLDTTVSGVQAAIALEALVSAAFILIGGKVGDLIGRKRAYALGLVGYAIGAVAMTLAQDLTAIIIFWAIVGGTGASLLLPAMQSLIHGNFAGEEQRRVYALVGASASVAAAIGPLLGGFITTFLSWRVAFALEAAIIAAVLSGSRGELGGGLLRPRLRQRDHAGDALRRLRQEDRSQCCPAACPAAARRRRARRRRRSDEQFAARRTACRRAAAGPRRDRRHTNTRPLALQVALLVPLLAGLAGLANSFRMVRLPDAAPPQVAEGAVLG